MTWSDALVARLAPTASASSLTVPALLTVLALLLASPTASAASIHPRKPMPVVATTTSGGLARISRVRATRLSAVL